MVWITPHKTYYFRNVHPRSIPPQFLPDIMFVFLHYLSFLRRNRNHPTLPDSVTFPVHNPSGSNSHIRDRFLRSERNPYTAQSLLLGFDVLPPTDLLPMPGLAYCAKVKKSCFVRYTQPFPSPSIFAPQLGQAIAAPKLSSKLLSNPHSEQTAALVPYFQ